MKEGTLTIYDSLLTIHYSPFTKLKPSASQEYRDNPDHHPEFQES
jgi:hypothetical protein